jgi:hypothetical protein
MCLWRKPIFRSDAEAFTPASNYNLTSAAAVLDGKSTGGTVNFDIFSNNSGTPGTLLATLGTATVSPTASGTFTESTLSQPVELLANTQYWLVLTPATSATYVVWDSWFTPSYPLAPFASTEDTTGQSGWATYGSGSNSLQFQIDGTLVTSTPEPPSGWLALVTLGGILFIPGKKR